MNKCRLRSPSVPELELVQALGLVLELVPVQALGLVPVRARELVSEQEQERAPALVRVTEMVRGQE